jgi:alpha-tubulin suppressor-like RCC1 family protein
MHTDLPTTSRGMGNQKHHPALEIVNAFRSTAVGFVSPRRPYRRMLERLDDRFVCPLGLSLSLSPEAATIFVSDTILPSNSAVLTLSASSLGRAVQTPAGVEWTSADPSIATVNADGAVTAHSVGTTTVTARVNSTKASATIVVAYGVSQLGLSVTSLAGVAGDTIVLAASALDAKGTLVPGTAYAFTAADPTVASVTLSAARTARVILLKSGVATVNVTAGGKTASATGAVQPREFISTPVAGAPTGALVLSAGEDATCGLFPLGRAYCFGRAGLLGTAKDTVCFNDNGRSTEGCSLIPLRVGAQLNFVSVSVGDSVACGATADNRAYCWGSQTYGQLGNGVAKGGTSTAPALVIGAVSKTAVSLSRVSAGGNHACGLSPSGAAFCWGKDSSFQLGNGDGIVANSTTPIPVAGGNTFSSISAGHDHTCALTSSGAAFCWGDNSSGQLGSATPDVIVDNPVPVTGPNGFSQISSGAFHTCALNSVGAAFCWGDNSSGQLGNGDASGFPSTVPAAVAGGLRFKSISAGWFSTCGITTAGTAFCWGDNFYWQLGTTNGFFTAAPTAVSGGRSDFTSVTVGMRHACGATPSGAYCWGSNFFGALGNEFQAMKQATPQKTITP